MNSPNLCKSILAVPVLFGLLAGAPGCGKEAPIAAPPEVKVVEAIQKDVPIIREWVGQTSGAVDIEIRARVNGWLTSMDFKEGTELRKGTLLYTIDDSELRQQVAEARGKLAEANTLLVRAQADVNRYRPLAAAGAVSQRDLERALAEAGARQGEVDAAKASLNVAEINLGYATVTAPIDGLIGISRARVGDFVGRPPNPIILNTISRVDTIHVRFSITEQEYMDLIRRFGAAKKPRAPEDRIPLEMVLADGSIYPLKGTAVFAQRQIDESTGTLLIEAAFPNPGRSIRPGQFAKVRAVFEERKGATLVPARSVIELQGQYIVYAVTSENKAQFRKVTLGPKFGQLQVVEQGVSPGEKVIVEGIQKVRPDAVVSATLVSMPADSTSTQEASGGGK